MHTYLLAVILNYLHGSGDLVSLRDILFYNRLLLISCELIGRDLFCTVCNEGYSLVRARDDTVLFSERTGRRNNAKLTSTRS